MGGMPGMRPRGPVDNKRLYELLGVDRNSSTKEIKKAYRKKAMKAHPDKGGDEEHFKELTRAAEILCDEEKRATYDEYGEEGLKEGGGGGGHSDLFEAMFGGMTARRRGPQKGENVKHVLTVSLEDLHNGKTTKLAIVRNRVCSSCGGKGTSKPGAITTCNVCHGRGIKVGIRQLGPGMVEQVQTICPACSGNGEVIQEKFKCRTCDGNKVAKERKIIEVHVDKGMNHGQKLVFSGEANENPGTIPGDVIVQLKQKQHKLFTRKGNNLIMEKTISLVEALCGFKFVVKQLDGRQLIVSSRPGEVIKPNDVKSIPGEGMPTWKRPFDKGFLFIQFTVEFPQMLSNEQSHLLNQILGPRPHIMLPSGEDVEEVDMIDYSPEQAHARTNGAAEAYEEDEEPENPRVQCAHQ